MSVETLIEEDSQKLLRRLLAPCDGDDNNEDHSWRQCRRCAALHLIERRDSKAMKLLEAALRSSPSRQGERCEATKLMEGGPAECQMESGHAGPHLSGGLAWE